MNKQIQDYIIEKTCSTTLRKSFIENNSILSEVDLILLVYYAKYHNSRMELSKLLLDSNLNNPSLEWIKNFIIYEKKVIKAVQKQEDNCIYEIKIKETSKSYEENYLSKTYSGAISKTNYFCIHYKNTILTEKSRIEIAKRIAKDIDDVESFGEDTIGWIKLDGNLIIIDVWYNGIEFDTKLENVKSIIEDDKYIDNHVINIPHFINNLDLIKYEDYNGEIVFAVAFISDHSWIENYAYCVRLDYEKIMSFNKRTIESFDNEICFMLHDHPHYMTIDVVDIKTVSKEYKFAYKKFVKLYNKFYK